jgi:hypothetical protein
MTTIRSCYIDGFTYKWFEALNKDAKPFLWKYFEEKFGGKFIPRYLFSKLYSPPFTPPTGHHCCLQVI